jgi:hypothetical protein
LRGVSFAAVNSRKRLCAHGHSLIDPANVYRHHGSRRTCRRCNATAVARYKSRRMALDSQPSAGATSHRQNPETLPAGQIRAAIGHRMGGSQ